MKQLLLPDMPPIDYAHVLERDRELRRRRRNALVLPTSGDIFAAGSPASPAPHEAALA
jgi:hypothetical protein